MTSSDVESEARLRVSVIVPTFQRIDRLPLCLAGIESLSSPPIEIIIVYRPKDDPATTRWLEAAAKHHHDWKLVEIQEPGVVAAQNAAIEVARGDILVIFDDDVVPRSGWLTKILEHFADNRVGAVGGRDLIHESQGEVSVPALARAGYRNWHGAIVGGHHLVVGRPRKVDVVKGCNWAIRKSALGTLRFDERLLGAGAQFGQEAWLCLGLRKAGWHIVLDPQAIVDHYPGFKPDYSYAIWSRIKCYEWTVNTTALSLAYLSFPRRLLYIFRQVIIGARSCPGLYFVVHGIFKRPRKLLGIMSGGWPGFLRGLRMASEFRHFPPGTATSSLKRIEPHGVESASP